MINETITLNLIHKIWEKKTLNINEKDKKKWQRNYKKYGILKRKKIIKSNEWNIKIKYETWNMKKTNKWKVKSEKWEVKKKGKVKSEKKW